MEQVDNTLPIYSKNPTEKKLEISTPKNILKIDEGENHVYLIDFDIFLAIFKPKAGEFTNDRENIPKGSFYLRERASYLVDKTLGFDLIPPTIIRNINGQIGSLQEYISCTQKFGHIKYKDQLKIINSNKDQFANLWLLDYIIWNNDRNKSNLLINSKNELFAIDNSLTFGQDQFFSFYNFENKKISPETIKKIEEFCSSYDKKNRLENSLKKLLGKKEAIPAINRIFNLNEILQKYGKIPDKNLLSFNPIK